MEELLETFMKLTLEPALEEVREQVCGSPGRRNRQCEGLRQGFPVCVRGVREPQREEMRAGR